MQFIQECYLLYDYMLYIFIIIGYFYKGFLENFLITDLGFCKKPFALFYDFFLYQKSKIVFDIFLKTYFPETIIMVILFF